MLNNEIDELTKIKNKINMNILTYDELYEKYMNYLNKIKFS
jgi:hypothetical protein